MGWQGKRTQALLFSKCVCFWSAWSHATLVLPVLRSEPQTLPSLLPVAAVARSGAKVGTISLAPDHALVADFMQDLPILLLDTVR
jgi:hypothetical protein